MPPDRERHLLPLYAGVSLIGFAVMAAAWFRPSETTYSAALCAGLLSGVACGLALSRLSRSPAWTERETTTRFVSVAFAALLVGALIWTFGRRQIGGFDHSVVIDFAWRVASGQRVFTDFPSTVPIGFVAGSGLAFRLLGAKFASLVAFQALAAVVSFVWSYWLLARVSRRRLTSLLLAFAIQSCANVVPSYWWYNPPTTTAAVLFFLSAAAFWREPGSRAVQLSYVCSLCLLAAMKPNVAGVLIVGVTAVMAFSERHRWKAAALSAVSFVLFVIALGACGVSLGDVIRGYSSIAERGLSLEQFLESFTAAERAFAIALLGTFLVPWVVFLARFRHRAPGDSLGLAAAVAGLCGFLINGESKLVDAPLLFLSVWWLEPRKLADVPAEELGATARRAAWTYVPFVAGVLIVCGVASGLVRQRVRGIGFGTYFQYELDPGASRLPFFSGVAVSRRLLDVEQEIRRLLDELQPRNPFFGPRLQWAYAAYGLRSPLREPVWWHAGVSYGRPDERALMARWTVNAHDAIVFLRDDISHLTDGLVRSSEIVSESGQPPRHTGRILTFSVPELATPYMPEAMKVAILSGYKPVPGFTELVVAIPLGTGGRGETAAVDSGARAGDR
jgi:hypothetical protein